MCCIGISGLKRFSSGRKGARVFQQRGSRAPCPGWGGHPAQADGAASSKLPSRAVSRQPSGPGLTQRPLSWWMVLLLPHGHQGKSPTNDAQAGLGVLNLPQVPNEPFLLSCFKSPNLCWSWLRENEISFPGNCIYSYWGIVFTAKLMLASSKHAVIISGTAVSPGLGTPTSSAQFFFPEFL